MVVERWYRTSRHENNIMAILLMVIVVALFAVATQQLPDAMNAFLSAAVTMAVLHGLTHVSTLRSLRAMVAMRVPHADQALDIYRDPLRIFHLDIAVAWIGVRSASRYLVAVW